MTPSPLAPAPASPPPAPFAIGEPVSRKFQDPAGYEPDADLLAAVQVALLLGMPLLLTGEPGCGKTSVAAWLALRMGLDQPPLVANVKSTTTGRDLLYEFDELARFRDGQQQRERHLAHYLRLNALGQAILCAKSPQAELPVPDPRPLLVKEPAPGAAAVAAPTLAAVSAPQLAKRLGRRQVVLIDELDKAPRDTPNDLLHEILEMSFVVREMDLAIAGSPALRPLVVITSNSEKSLPEPFLRRCVYHHIASPDDKTRRAIVARRTHPYAARPGFDAAMKLFQELTGALGRAPGTAELLAWLTMLEARHVEAAERGGPLELGALAQGTLGALAKTSEDLARAADVLRRLAPAPPPPPATPDTPGPPR